MLAATMAGALPAQSQDSDDALNRPARREPTPIVHAFENFPFPVRVPRGLYELDPIGEPFEYNRRLPIFGKEAADKGIILPRPWGTSLLGVYNQQSSTITDLSVALSLNGAPDADVDLKSVDFVNFSDAESETTSSQFKVDAWLFPFLNLFATRGRVQGETDMGITIDLDGFNETLPIPLPCSIPTPGNRDPQCGDLKFNVKPRIDADTYTLGFVAIKNWDRTIATLNGAYTFTDSRKENAETVIEVANIGAKVGRLMSLNRGITFTPYAGVNYTWSDNIIRGTVSSPDSEDTGGPIYIRYEVHQGSDNPWSGTVGFALGINDRWNVNLDLTAGKTLKRGVFGVTARF